MSVPFAATGAILLQIITGVPLGVASMIGVLMLIGIVVTNAIVLDRPGEPVPGPRPDRARGDRRGGSRRLRPILMTALATIFALLPMALGITGHGGFISQPLAIIVIGGLVSSTVLTLLVLPMRYNLVEGAKERRAPRRAGDGWPRRPAGPEPALVGAGAAGAPSRSSPGASFASRGRCGRIGRCGVREDEVPTIERGLNRGAAGGPIGRADRGSRRHRVPRSTKGPISRCRSPMRPPVFRRRSQIPPPRTPGDPMPELRTRMPSRRSNRA